MSHMQKMILSSVATLIALAAASALFIWPNYSKAASIREQIHDLKVKLDGYEGRAQQVVELEAQVAAIEQRIEHQLREIPEAHDMASLTQKLSQHVDRVQVMDQAFTTGAAGEAIVGAKSPMMAMPLTVDMEAKFDSVFALLQNAESIDRLVRIVSVKVSCKRDQKQPMLDQPLVTASIGLEAIFEPAAAPQVSP